MDAARSIPLVCSRNFIRLSRFPFQNVRLDRRVKHARLEQSGVKSKADHRCYCRGVCIMHKMTKLAQAVFVTSNKRGNEHHLSQFGDFMHVYNMYASA